MRTEVKKVLLVTILLFFGTAANASSKSIVRGASTESIIALVNSYPSFSEAVEEEGGTADLLKMIEITYACAHANRTVQTQDRATELLISTIETDETLSEEAKHSFIKSEIDRSNESLKSASKIVHVCDKLEVESGAQGLSWLLDLAESGYLPALLFYVNNPPPTMDVENPDELQFYEIQREAFINEALAQGSGEAMFLEAMIIRSSSRGLAGAPLTLTEAEEGYSFASAALKCGYEHPNVYGLLNYFIEEFGVDPQRTSTRTDEIVSQYCGRG